MTNQIPTTILEQVAQLKTQQTQPQWENRLNKLLKTLTTGSPWNQKTVNLILHHIATELDGDETENNWLKTYGNPTNPANTKYLDWLSANKHLGYNHKDITQMYRGHIALVAAIKTLKK